MSPRQLEQAITRKLGFTLSPHHARHRWYELALPGLETITTMVSHGTPEIGKPLESKIARQMCVSTALLREVIGCTKGRDEYVAAIERRHPRS